MISKAISAYFYSTLDGVCSIPLDYLSYFTNTPMYSIGDSVISQGSSSFSSGSGQSYVSYSYDEYLDGDYQSIYENYQYGESVWDQVQNYPTIREYFTYDLDENTTTVDSVYMNREQETYDNSGRIVAEEYIYMDIWGVDDFSQSYETETFTYINPTSKQILNHIVDRQYESQYSNEVSSTTYTYDYSGLIEDDIYDGRWDYTTRWGVETRTYNYDWSTDEVTTRYTKETRNNQANGNASSFMEVQVDDQGFITHTSVSDDRYSYGNNGSYTSSSSWKSSDDYDGDGIVNYLYESTSRYKNNRGSSTYLNKDDWDGDGYADSISMTRSSESSMGRMTTEYRYDATSFSQPILEIIRSLDTDMDGTADLIDEKSMFRTLTARHTAMGGHVATLNDVLAWD